MPRGKRKAAFIGTRQWVERDCAISFNGDPLDLGLGNVRLTDKPTGIWVQVPEEPATAERAQRLYNDLAHRVIQLTT